MMEVWLYVDSAYGKGVKSSTKYEKVRLSFYNQDLEEYLNVHG